MHDLFENTKAIKTSVANFFILARKIKALKIKRTLIKKKIVYDIDKEKALLNCTNIIKCYRKIMHVQNIDNFSKAIEKFPVDGDFPLHTQNINWKLLYELDKGNEKENVGVVIIVYKSESKPNPSVACILWCIEEDNTLVEHTMLENVGQLVDDSAYFPSIKMYFATKRIQRWIREIFYMPVYPSGRIGLQARDGFKKVQQAFNQM